MAKGFREALRRGYSRGLTGREPREKKKKPRQLTSAELAKIRQVLKGGM